MSTTAPPPRHVPAGTGERIQLMHLGVVFKVFSEETGGGLSIVEHPLAPRGLGAPLHTHTREDEYSYVLEGRIGVQLGEDVLTLGVGDLVLKPRGVPHTFWNPTDEPACLLEIITPGGFEGYFRRVAEIVPPATDGPDLEALGRVAGEYGLEVDPTSIPRLAAEHGLAVPPMPGS